jgi:hypothetical protein
MLVSLLAILIAARGLAQTAKDGNAQPLPSWVNLPSQTPLSQVPNPASGGMLMMDAPLSLDGSMDVPPVTTLSEFMAYRYLTGEVAASPPPPSQTPGSVTAKTLTPGTPLSIDGSGDLSPVASLSEFLGYRYLASSLDWIPGGGDQLGMFSIVWNHYQKSGITSGIGGLGIGMGFHFLGGPEQTDMPPRVYDFSIGYQIRRQWGPLKFDLGTSVLAASDFEGNARKGVCYPSHGVGFLSVNPTTDVVFGVDYVDRGDVKLLPVVGLIWIPNPEMRFELVFPRPRAVFQLFDQYHLYVSGELGGGTWAIERIDSANDLATYRDLRVCVGIEHVQKDGQRSALEVGYLFDRYLSYNSGIGNMPLDDAMLLRLVTTF